MTIDLKPELAARLKRAAEEQGIAPETLAARKLDEAFPDDPMRRVLWNGMTVEQWIRETREWTQGNRGAHIPPDAALTRESLYADHD